MSPNYCVCRRGDVGPMVACDRCNDWFHLRCMNIANEKDLDDKWFCRLCKEVNWLKADFDSQIVVVKNKISGIEQRQLYEDNVVLNQARESLKEQVDALKKENEKLKSENLLVKNRASAEVQELKEEVGRLAEENEKLKSENLLEKNKASAEIQELRERVGRLTEENVTIKRETTSLQLKPPPAPSSQITPGAEKKRSRLSLSLSQPVKSKKSKKYIDDED